MDGMSVGLNDGCGVVGATVGDGVGASVQHIKRVGCRQVEGGEIVSENLATWLLPFACFHVGTWSRSGTNSRKRKLMHIQTSFHV